MASTTGSRGRGGAVARRPHAGNTGGHAGGTPRRSVATPAPSYSDASMRSPTAQITVEAGTVTVSPVGSGCAAAGGVRLAASA